MTQAEPIPAHTGEQQEHHDACVRLWGAVIKLAFLDAAYEQDLPEDLNRHQKRRSNGTKEARKFFDSEWFTDICHMMGASPERVMAGLKQEGAL